jgi:Cu+-exporting ATPase
MRTHYLTVTGMTCLACRGKVAETLGMLPGVGDVRFSAALGSVTVHCNDQQISLGELISALEEAGYGIDCAAAGSRQYPLWP